MDAPERQRALAGGRIPATVRWLTAGVTLVTLLGVSYFVASFIGFDLPHRMVSNVPLLVASVVIGAVGIGVSRRLVDRRAASPWLAVSVVAPLLAALQESGVL